MRAPKAGVHVWTPGMAETHGINVDPAEVARFNALAHRWWDDQGEMRLLHLMNPVRFGYIESRVALAGKRCLDVGCGAGLLSEALAGQAGHVTGIDLAADALAVARLHAMQTGISNLSYRDIAADQLSREEPGAYDVVTCMEMLEHVPDPAAAVQACAELVPGGGHLFFSTINRTLQAYLVTVIGAEYVLGLLPRGTHRFEAFIRPSEMEQWGRAAGLELQDLAGLRFNPASGEFSLGNQVDINYIAHFRAGRNNA